MSGQGKSAIIGSDHGGVEVKNWIVKHLQGKGYMVDDCGVFTNDSVDYPDTSEAVCRKFLLQSFEFGIVLCGTGIGASIAANKISGIRCALVHDLYTAEMAKAHNNANILTLGAQVVGVGLAQNIVKTWLETPFGGGRHERRVNKISDIEKRVCKTM